MTTLVTGANGFISSALCARLIVEGKSLRGAVRAFNSGATSVEIVEISSLSFTTDWSVALQNVDQVVHLAARVHVMNDKSADRLAEFRRVNVEGTENHAR